MRRTLEVDDLDYAHVRIGVMAKNAYSVFLNGNRVVGYVWFDGARYRPFLIEGKNLKHLKKGKNVLCVMAFKEFSGILNPTGWPPEDGPAIGVIDCRIDGVKKSNLKRRER